MNENFKTVTTLWLPNSLVGELKATAKKKGHRSMNSYAVTLLQAGLKNEGEGQE